MRNPSREGIPPNYWHGVLLQPEPSIGSLTLSGHGVHGALRASLGAGHVVSEALCPGIDMWRTETTKADATPRRLNTWAMAIAQVCKGAVSASAVVGNVVLLGRSPGGFSTSLSPEAQKFIHEAIQGIATFLEAC